MLIWRGKSAKVKEHFYEPVLQPRMKIQRLDHLYEVGLFVNSLSVTPRNPSIHGPT